MSSNLNQLMDPRDCFVSAEVKCERNCVHARAAATSRAAVGVCASRSEVPNVDGAHWSITPLGGGEEGPFWH